MIFKPSGARKTISDLSVQKWANPGTQGLITRGGFGMRFFEDPQSPIPIPIFHFGLDQKIFENPQKKILKKSPILSRGLGIFENLGIFISEIRQIQGIGVFWGWGFFGDGDFSFMGCDIPSKRHLWLITKIWWRKNFYVRDYTVHKKQKNWSRKKILQILKFTTMNN